LSIAEIGAGSGMTAYYGIILGFGKYHLFDLPQICVLQYYALRKSLPTKKIILGEGSTMDIYDIALSNGLNFSSNGLSYNYVLNVDSFPEMGDEIAHSYLQAIFAKSATLFSINQESLHQLTNDPSGPRQISVKAILENLENIQIKQRNKCWVRKNYVEMVVSRI
jgi:hypothetical protein